MKPWPSIPAERSKCNPADPAGAHRVIRVAMPHGHPVRLRLVRGGPDRRRCRQKLRFRRIAGRAQARTAREEALNPFCVRACWRPALLAVGLLAAGSAANAQSVTVRLAKQFGISYMPLTIMEQKHLLEAQGKALGLEIKTEWVQFTSGTPMNEALISGNLDFASGGVGPLLTIWGKTRDNLGVKAVAALNSM